MNHNLQLTHSLDDVGAADIVIVGSGPSGVAVAEQLFERAPTLSLAIVERGGILALTHFNNILANDLRRTFLDRFGEHPWEGDCSSGMLLPAVGGRGIAAGALLRRFDPVDFDLWRNGQWPEPTRRALDRFYPIAEERRRVCTNDPRGEAQIWAATRLARWRPSSPPIGVDLGRSDHFTPAAGYDSSAARLWRLLLRDRLQSTKPRLHLLTGAFAERLDCEGTGVRALECLGASGRRKRLEGGIFIVAASPIESARMLLNSGLQKRQPLVGRYLADHIERRARVELVGNQTIGGEGISLVMAPVGEEVSDPLARFQVHLRGQKRGDRMVVDIGGFAAMDPNPENAVSLSESLDQFGVARAQTRLTLSADDRERARRLSERIVAVAEAIGPVRFMTTDFPLEQFERHFTCEGRVQVMPAGRSYHEAGTLRMGESPVTSVTDLAGRVHGLSNLFVADAALFPSVGIANPMLTCTALAYHVATCAAAQLRGDGVNGLNRKYPQRGEG